MPAAPPPLRIGLFIDSLTQPAWVAHELRAIVEAGIAVVQLVVLNAAAESHLSASSVRTRAAKWFENRARLPFAAYLRLDAWRYKPKPDPFAPSDISDLVHGAEILRVIPQRSKHVDRFDQVSIAKICAFDLDVALLLGFRIIKGDILKIAKYGIWSFHHGDNRFYRGGPAGFWEIASGEVATGAILQVLSESLDGGDVVSRSRSRTILTSLAANRAGYYPEAAAMLKRELTFLRHEGRAGFDREGSPADWHPFDRPIYTAPRGGEVVRVAGAIARRLLVSKGRSLLWREQWSIAIAQQKRQSSESSSVPCDVMYKYRPVPSPPDRYWADPFPVHDAGRDYLFVEEHFHGRKAAHISVMEVAEGNVLGPPTIVLTRPYHLSYPVVFRWQDDWFMMPETSQANAVELFRAKAFPYEWEPAGTAVADIRLLDPTVAEIDGQWWLFGATRVHGASEASALHLYYGPSPLGPWTAHRYNPVKIDVRGARPAGHLFKQGGAWFRPGQDGAPRYGSGIVIHRIDEISPTRFRETALSRIEPNWQPGLTGIHTINAAEGLSAIDVRRRVRRGR